MWRPGGGGWALHLSQDSLKHGYKNCPTIGLDVRDADSEAVCISLTTGDARVLARQLIALADDADLSVY